MISTKNQNKRVMKVRFFGLKPYDPHGEGGHKAHCPVCEEGVLLMHRHEETGELIAYDVCAWCGQRFEYTDIDEVRRLRP